MRIGDFEVNIKRFADTSGVDTSELGGSGTTIYNGIISDIDYNSKLTGSNRFNIYDRMRKSDPVIRASLSLIELLLTEAEWRWDCEDEELAEFANEALFDRPTQSWREILHNTLLMLPYGFSVLEKVFEVADGQVYWRKLPLRHPSTIHKWKTEDGQDGIVQMLYGGNVGKGGTQPSIPIEKLLVFTHQKEGDNWEGVSLLRGAYKPFFFKENFEKISAIGFERQAVGVPVFRMPPNPKETDKDMAEEIGKNLRANEKAHVLLPDGWDLEILNMKGDTTKTATEDIWRMNWEILTNVLASFLALGTKSSGSWALSKDLSSLFDLSVQALGNQIAEIFTEHGMKQLIDLNFDSVEEYPKLRVEGVGRTDLEEFTKSIQSLSQARMLTPEDNLEEHLRSKMRLPDLPEEMKGQREEMRKNLPIKDQSQGQKDEQKEGDKEEEREEAVTGAEVIPDGGFWRGMTGAEKKIDWEKLRDTFDELEYKYSSRLLRALNTEQERILQIVKEAIESGQPGSLAMLKPQIVDRLASILSEALGESFEVGKRVAADEIKTDAPSTPTKVQQLNGVKARAVAEEINQAMVDDARLAALEHIEKGSNVGMAIRDVENSVSNAMKNKTGVASNISVVGGVNRGRDYAFQQNQEKIYALQRSELLDSRTCNYCLSMDGRVVEVDDPIAQQNQFHPYCRGIWVSILEEEMEKPDVTGVPDSLRKRVGNIMDMDQLERPEPLEDSQADDYVSSRR